MNLLEFKRFCQLRQNWSYVFIKVNDSEFANVGPVVIERPESNKVIVRSDENFDIVPWTKVVDSVCNKLNTKERINLIGKFNIVEVNPLTINTTEFTTVSKLGIYVDYTVAFSCSKSELITEMDSNVESKYTKDGSIINNLNIKNNIKLNIINSLNYLGIINEDILMKSKINVVEEPLTITAVFNEEDNLKTKIKNSQPKIISTGNLGENKFESIILGKDGKNTNQEIIPDYIMRGRISLGRLATLDDYKDNTLKELNNYYGEDTNLFNLKYYIIN